MTDLSVTILNRKPKTPRRSNGCHERTFGPGRYARTAYRIREQLGHRLDLSTRRASARCWSLGAPHARAYRRDAGAAARAAHHRPPFRDAASARPMMERALEDAKARLQARRAGRR